MSAVDLCKSPFGRSLSLLLLHLPKRASIEGDWALERGFHLQLLSSELFVLRLADETKNSEIFPEEQPDGSTRFLLWQLPDDQSLKQLPQFLHTLRESSPWEAALILGHIRDSKSALWREIRRGGALRGLGFPVVGVHQDRPPSDFFTVEKNLFHLGRIGRRLRRYAKLRNLLPL